MPMTLDEFNNLSTTEQYELSDLVLVDNTFENLSGPQWHQLGQTLAQCRNLSCIGVMYSNLDKLTSNQWGMFCHALTQCSSLSAIVLTGNNLSSLPQVKWQPIANLLASLNVDYGLDTSIANRINSIRPSNYSRPKNEMVLASFHAEIGLAHETKTNLTEAQIHNEKALRLYQRLDPNSTNEAVMHYSMGCIYKIQGKLSEALSCLEQSLRIEHMRSDSLDIGSTYNIMGMIYKTQGKLAEALSCCQQSAHFNEQFRPNSFDLATSYNSLALLYQMQGKFDNSLRYYEQSLQINESLAPNSPKVAYIYNNLGTSCILQGKFPEAIIHLKKALQIYEKLPESASLARTYDTVGNWFKAQNQLDNALKYYDKALHIQGILEMQGKMVPDSHEVATFSHNKGMVCKAQGKLSEALALYQKAFLIKARDFIPQHPDLIALSHDIADMAYQLRQYDVALKYIDICLEKDNSFKYAYHTKGCIYRQQGHLQNAVAAFNSALACDAGYADAALNKAEALKEIAKTTGNFKPVTDALAQAQAMQKTSYDATLKKEYEQNALAANHAMEVKLPQQDTQVGSQTFNTTLSDLYNEIDNVKQRMSAAENRIDTFEVRLNILDQKVYGLQHSMEVLAHAQADIQKRMEEVKADNELVPAVRQDLMNSLILERNKMKERETQVKRFNRQPDLADFYHALLSELSAAFMVAQVIGSEKITMNGSTKYTQAANAANMVMQLIPLVGPLASSLTNGLAVVADTIGNVKTQNDLLRIRELAPTTEEFDRIAMRVAIQLTLSHETQICALRGASVPQNWKTHVKSISQGLEGFIASFIADNNTLAKLWGRAEAQAVITHLQEPHVAENYRYEDEQEDYSRLSVVANTIVSIRSPAAEPHSIHKNVLAPQVTPPKQSWGDRAAAPVAPSMNLDELLTKCRSYSSENSAKTTAVKELIKKLEDRAKGSISSKDVLDFISYQLKVTFHPAFARTFGFGLGKSSVKALYEQGKEAMTADMARINNPSMADRSYFGLSSGNK